MSVNNHEGFSLVEIVVVITVIGILTAVGVLGYGNWRQNINTASVKSDLANVASAMENARNFGESGYPGNIASLSNLTVSENVEILGGSTDADNSTYCVEARFSSDPSIVYYIDNEIAASGPMQGDCASRPGLAVDTCSEDDRYGTFPDCYDYDALPIATSIYGHWEASQTPPEGYLIEDGSAVSRTVYDELFAIIGTTYGAGDGSTTFNLPDSRGRLSVNKSSSDGEFDAIGEKGGEKTHVLTVSEMPSHNHSGTFSTTSHGHGISGTTSGGNDQDSYEDNQEQDVAEVSHTHGYSGWTGVPSAYSGLNSQGSNTAHENIQPSVVNKYAIKYTPSTGSYSMLPVGVSIEGYWPDSYRSTLESQGWLYEDGSAVSRTIYDDLFAALGTSYGVGDGTTTFNVPNSMGRTAVGLSTTDTEFDAIGEKYGEKYHTVSLAELPVHSHNSQFATIGHQHYFSGNTSTLNYPDGRDSYNDPNEQAGANVSHIHSFSGWSSVTDHGAQTVANQGGGQGHNELQPYIVKSYIIKHTPVSGEADTLPKGTLVRGYFSAAPIGYHLADGSEVLREGVYSGLFAAIGTTYGAGDGLTTFNLPNLGGKAVVHQNTSDSQFDNLGELYGSKTITLSIAEMPSHNHGSQFASASHTHNFSFWSGGPSAKNRVDDQNDQEGANMGHVHIVSGTTGGPNVAAWTGNNGSGGAHNNIQPSITQNFAIKY